MTQILKNYISRIEDECKVDTIKLRTVVMN